jgi:ribose-phosphate pyrophosphokinase
MSLRIDDKELSFTKTTFPGGESCIRVEVAGDELPKGIAIQLDFESNSDLFDLALLVDAIRRVYDERITPRAPIMLFLPYAPYARQDRVCNEGESLSIKVVADFINALNFESVCIVDPHSDVTSALFNNVVVIPQETFASCMFQGLKRSNTIIVAPDAGASKKARKFAQAGGFAGLLQAEKVRDLSTGKILKTKINVDELGPPDVDYLIVDDICDGGRTFTELAKVLRPTTIGKIMLFVTHGIFSAGTEVFDNLIDEVYTANPVGATGKAAVESGKVKRI